MTAPFFIVASARSGTTFLRLTLNAHGSIAVPPESRFITEFYTNGQVDVPQFLQALKNHKRFKLWDLSIDLVRSEIGTKNHIPYAEAISAAHRAYARSRGKSIWGDKTPRYIEHISFLANLFPDSRFIHLVRDGRNVALSYAHVDFGPKNVARVAELWTRRVATGIKEGRPLGDDRYLEIRAEDLALDVHAQLEKVCRFLGVDVDPSMFDPAELAKGEIEKKRHNYSPEAAGRAAMSDWTTDMKPEDVEVFEALAGPVLTQLGYERRYQAPSRTARVKAALALRGAPIGRLK
ncbi:MAG: sulfotransferase [Actinobacteria bacterium]|nr:sulfotransferase [Actinomycetota bacterium]